MLLRRHMMPSSYPPRTTVKSHTSLPSGASLTTIIGRSRLRLMLLVLLMTWRSFYPSFLLSMPVSFYRNFVASGAEYISEKLESITTASIADFYVASSFFLKSIASRKETRSCFYCTKPGHIAPNCSLKERFSPKVKTYSRSAKYSAVDSALRHSEYSDAKFAANSLPNWFFSDKMYLNSRAKNHMFSSKGAFEFLAPCEPISIPNTINGIGSSSVVSSAKGSVLLKNVLWCYHASWWCLLYPRPWTNLISVHNICKKLDKSVMKR